MNEVTTPILSADPWLKSRLLAGSKDGLVRPSKPAPNLIAGLEQDPKSRPSPGAAVVAVLVLVVAVELLLDVAEAVSDKAVSAVALAVDVIAVLESVEAPLKSVVPATLRALFQASASTQVSQRSS